MTATLVGAWELRAGSHDTEEWLDGAADTTYPGGGPGTFSAVNSDGATGYDPAPKMAIITLGTFITSEANLAATNLLIASGVETSTFPPI